MLDVGQRMQLVVDNINHQDLIEYKFLIPKKYFENEYVKSVVEIYNIKYILLEDHKLYKIKNLIIPCSFSPKRQL